MSELEELLERLRRGPELVAAVLTGAAGSEVDFRPAPAEWCVRQIVAHLSDSEMAAAFRLRRLIAEDHPALEAYDQNAWAERLDYGRRKPSQSLETFRRVRQENYELLRGLAPEDLTRTGTHTEKGVISVLELAESIAAHAESHAKQIRRVRDAFKAQKAAQQSQ